MLWTIFVILLVLWLLGVVSSNTLGGFIHILLVLAVAIVLLRLIQHRHRAD
ncbi:MAG TPA: lmo0937 family membrane protein [Gemmatimonadales bacterium]|nr:lmo0937 family membrane protein [Gemmatimonadales bacterium]